VSLPSPPWPRRHRPGTQSSAAAGPRSRPAASRAAGDSGFDPNGHVIDSIMSTDSIQPTIDHVYAQQPAEFGFGRCAVTITNSLQV